MGGRLYLTNQRLVFEAHALNVQTGSMVIPLAAITETTPCWTKFLNLIPIAPNSLAVSTADGKQHRFVLFGRREWKRAIDAQIAQHSG